MHCWSWKQSLSAILWTEIKKRYIIIIQKMGMKEHLYEIIHMVGLFCCSSGGVNHIISSHTQPNVWKKNKQTKLTTNWGWKQEKTKHEFRTTKLKKVKFDSFFFFFFFFFLALCVCVCVCVCVCTWLSKVHCETPNNYHKCLTHLWSSSSPLNILLLTHCPVFSADSPALRPGPWLCDSLLPVSHTWLPNVLHPFLLLPVSQVQAGQLLCVVFMPK